MNRQRNSYVGAAVVIGNVIVEGAMGDVDAMKLFTPRARHMATQLMQERPVDPQVLQEITFSIISALAVRQGPFPCRSPGI